MALDDLLKLMAAAAAILVPTAAIIAAFLTWLGPKKDEDDPPKTTLGLSDAATVQGSSLQLAEAQRAHITDLQREILRLSAERDVAVAERDLAHDALAARGEDPPTLRLPEQQTKPPKRRRS